MSLLLWLAACAEPTPDAPAPVALAPVQVGPPGGWVASLAWRTDDEVWASGDDSGGLWRSVDAGRTWSRIDSYPQEHATYALRFDPVDPDRAYAPSYAGLGVARTTDGGATWSVHREGLPAEPNDAVAFDLAIDPADPDRLFLATVSGLYTSLDAGSSWSLVDPRPTSALAFAPSGLALWVAADTEVLVSLDGVQFVPASTCELFGFPVPVTDLVATEARVYVGCFGGAITAIEVGEALETTTLSDGSALQSGLWTHLDVVAGPTPDEDRLLVGTTAPAEGSDYGVFRSLDGGRSFTSVVGDTSAFAVAWHPTDPGVALVSGAPDRLRRLEGLQSATPRALVVGDFGLHCCGVVVDPLDPDHWLLSSSVLISGMPHTLWETRDAGATWSPWEVSDPVTGRRHLNAWQLFVRGDEVLFATPAGVTGGTEPTLLRSRSGVDGPFVVEDVPRVLFEGFAAWGDHTFAAGAYGLDDPADSGLYRRVGDGPWSRLLSGSVRRVIVRGDVLLGFGDDVARIDLAEEGAPCSLGFAEAFPGESLGGGDVDGDGVIFVGASSGRLFAFEPLGACEGVWRELASPFGAGTAFTAVVHSGGSSWVLGATVLSGGWPSTATPGLMATDDGGASWRRLEEPSMPSENPYTLTPVGDGSLLMGTVAAGIWRVAP